ncbi:MAG TPA: enolase C-terminal domain-like protein [Chthonomonadaceae bacterium]|nr:enolase C-terminal domain-like protein [Chthonomonadaceae bacterium]
MHTISLVTTQDARFPLQPGEGVDAIHSNPIYSYAVTRLVTDKGLIGVGLALTLGGGNDLVCQAIEPLAQVLVGQDIEALMADFGRIQRRIADHPQYRWLGPHKGVVHLALASITNACFDLWAKARAIPLWRLLLDLTPEQIVALLDLSYLEDVLPAEEALGLLEANRDGSAERMAVLKTGYPGYDTSVGWFHYPDELIRVNARRTLEEGFTALKLKVGSAEIERDVRRAHLVRETVGSEVRIMLDANQQWTLPRALPACAALAPMSPYWIEEPTHPDDVLAHQTLARAIAPLPVALGEHVPNRVLFKNFMQAGAASFIQVDAVRVAGVSEFLTVSLLARKFGLKVVPHVGDMGQIHQHLVLFNHIALGLEKIFLETIPHLRQHFAHPARVSEGVYHTPQEPGSSSDLRV